MGWGPVNHPRIFGTGTANPPVRPSQEQSFHAAGYQGERIRKIFLNSDIEYRHFYLEGALNRKETSDQLNQHYLRGAMKTGLRVPRISLKDHRSTHAASRRWRSLATSGSWPRDLENEMGHIH